MPKGSYTISNWCHSSSFSRDCSSEQRNPKPSIRRHPASEICNHISGSNHPSENHIRRRSSSECCTTKSEIFIGGDSRIGQRSSSDGWLRDSQVIRWLIRELCASDLTESADGDFVGLAKIGSEQFEDAMEDWGRRAVFRSNSIWAIQLINGLDSVSWADFFCGLTLSPDF
ncbi:hypothetical protein LXL04_025538 [Taraxacum kok-saghyz]